MSSGVVSQRTSTTASPARAAPLGGVGVEDGGARRRRRARRSGRARAARTPRPGRCAGAAAASSCARVDAAARPRRASITPSRDELAHDPQRGLRGALARARLQQVERAALDGELDVLHVAVVLLEALDRRDELARRPRAAARPCARSARACGCRRRRPRPGRSAGTRRTARARRSRGRARSRRRCRELSPRLPNTIWQMLTAVPSSSEMSLRAPVDVRARRVPASGRPREIARRSCSRGSCGNACPAPSRVEPLELGARARARSSPVEIDVELDAALAPCARVRASSKTCDSTPSTTSPNICSSRR